MTLVTFPGINAVKFPGSLELSGIVLGIDSEIFFGDFFTCLIFSVELISLLTFTSIFFPLTIMLGLEPLKSTSTSYFLPSISNKYFFIKPL